jgi:hypothetical protein
MASTRNINTKGNYDLQQKQYEERANYLLFKNSQYGEAINTEMAGNGLLQGKLPRNKMSFNPIEIESFLFGINSTNLVKPEPVFTPALKNMSTRDIFQKENTIMPLPLIIERNRPFNYS